MSAADLGRLAAVLAGRLEDLMPPGPRRDRLVADLGAFAGREEPVTAAACRALEAACHPHARHLELLFDPAGDREPDVEPPGWPPPDPAAIRARAGGVGAVRRHDDGTCVITLDSLEDFPHAQPYLDGAFALAAGAARLVLDLRANGGGSPATVAAIAGRLLGDDDSGRRPLSEVIYRHHRRQWWPRDPAPASVLRQPVAVLVAGHTYSSAEALAYHLQARGRVTVVGEPTRGAADHVTPVRLTRQVVGLLPEATVLDGVTGGNWEGRGVLPDVACPAKEALEVAVRHMAAAADGG